MKKIVRLTETDLHNMIMECVLKVLKEEVDTGQSLNAQDRKDKSHESSSEKEIRNKIRQLRQKLWNAESEEEKEKYRNMINKLKEKL